MSEGKTKVVYTHTNGNRLIRGKRPDTECVPYLQGLQNIKTVINLEMGWFEFFHRKFERECQWARKNGISLANLPMSDFFKPTHEQTILFLKLVDNALNCGDVYFHCLHGQDRTGYMCAAFRIVKQGWKPQQAIDEMLELGFHEFPYGWWIESLKGLK